MLKRLLLVRIKLVYYLALHYYNQTPEVIDLSKEKVYLSL